MNDNPSAFPCVAFGPLCEAIHQEGMTLRDYFAGQALASFDHAFRVPESDAKKAYAIADAMLAERKKGGDA